MAAKTAGRRPWIKTDVADLKRLAREKTPARRLGQTRKRSEGAVRQKAMALGISIGIKKTGPAKKASNARRKAATKTAARGKITSKTTVV